MMLVTTSLRIHEVQEAGNQNVTTEEAIAARSNQVAPAVGFEPTTKRLTAARSTTELRRNAGGL